MGNLRIATDSSDEVRAGSDVVLAGGQGTLGASTLAKIPPSPLSLSIRLN